MENTLNFDQSSFDRGVAMIREIGNIPDVVEETNARFNIMLRIAGFLASSPQRFAVDFDEGDRAKIYLQSTEEQDEPQLVIFTAYKGGDIEDISIFIGTPPPFVRNAREIQEEPAHYRIDKENLPVHLSDIRHLAVSDRYAETTVDVQEAHRLLDDIFTENAVDPDNHLVVISENDTISRTQRGILAFYNEWNT